MITNFNITSDMTINAIKNIAIKHFYGDDTLRNPSDFRLIHSTKFKCLIDNYNIINENINENGKILKKLLKFILNS